MTRTPLCPTDTHACNTLLHDSPRERDTTFIPINNNRLSPLPGHQKVHTRVLRVLVCTLSSDLSYHSQNQPARANDLPDDPGIEAYGRLPLPSAHYCLCRASPLSYPLTSQTHSPSTPLLSTPLWFQAESCQRPHRGGYGQATQPAQAGRREGERLASHGGEHATRGKGQRARRCHAVPC